MGIQSAFCTIAGFHHCPWELEMDTQKVVAVQERSVPDNHKQFQRFLGFVNFYRHSCSSHCTPLNSTKIPFRWTTDVSLAFNALKHRFITTPVLSLPDPCKQFVGEVNAVWELYCRENCGSYHCEPVLQGSSLCGVAQNLHGQGDCWASVSAYFLPPWHPLWDT